MAIHFDGSSQYLSNASYAQPAYPFSMSCWFIADQDTSYDVAFCMSDGSNEEHSVGYAGNIGGEPLYVLTRTSAGVSYASFGGTISTATWHNGIGVWAAANSRQAFLDGAAQTAATQTATLTNGQVGIGRSLRSAGTYWDGKVAECAMWDIALPQQAIDAIAAGASPLLVYPQNLIDYWPLWSTTALKSIAGRHTLLSATGTPTDWDHPPIAMPGWPSNVVYTPGAAPGGFNVASAMRSTVTLTGGVMA